MKNLYIKDFLHYAQKICAEMRSDMRAFSDVYLGDVVENQGKLFDFVAQSYPDKDT